MTPLRRTPARNQTQGMLLSSIKRSGPRQSFDIEKYERVKMPRLPSLHLESAPDEEDERELDSRNTHDVKGDLAPYGEGPEDEEVYEGNSMTLADILLQAGHQGNASMQLLEEDELENMSDWD